MPTREIVCRTADNFEYNTVPILNALELEETRLKKEYESERDEFDSSLVRRSMLLGRRAGVEYAIKLIKGGDYITPAMLREKLKRNLYRENYNRTKGEGL